MLLGSTSTSWKWVVTSTALLLAVITAAPPVAAWSGAPANVGDEPEPYRYPAVYLCGDAGDSGPSETLVVAANPSSEDLVVDVIVRGDRTTSAGRTVAAGGRLSIGCADLPDGSGASGFVDLHSAEPLDVIATYQTTVSRGTPATAVAGISVVVQLERSAENDAERAAFAALGLEPWVPKTLLVLAEVPADGLLVPIETATRGLEQRLTDVLAQSGFTGEDAEGAARRIVTEDLRCWVELEETDIAQGGGGTSGIAVSIDVVPVPAAPMPTASTGENGDDTATTDDDGTNDAATDDGDDTTDDDATDDDGNDDGTTDDDGNDDGNDDGTNDDGTATGQPTAAAFSGTVVIDDDNGWLALWFLLLLLAFIVVVLLVVALAFWLTRRRRQEQRADAPPDAPPAVPAPTPVPPSSPSPPSAAYDISCAFEGERHIDVDDRAATLRITMILLSPENVVRGAGDGRLVLRFDFTDQSLTLDGRAAGELTFELPDHVAGEPVVQAITVASGAFSAPDLDAPSADVGIYEFAGTVSSRPEPPVDGLDSIETTSTLRFAVAHD